MAILKRIIKKNLYTVYAIFNYALFLIRDYPKIRKCERLFFFPYYHTGGAERIHVAILHALKQEKCVVIFTMGSATKSFYKGFKSSAEIVEINPILNKHISWITSRLATTIIRAIYSSTSLKTIFGCNSSYFYELLPQLPKSLQKVDLFHAFEINDFRIPTVVASAPFLTHRIVINQKAKNDLESYYHKHQVEKELLGRIQIIPNGIPLDKHKYTAKSSSQITIGFVGRWSVEKRPELFLKIAKILKANLKDIHFVMAGTGMKSNIDLIHSADVTFLGEITEKEKMNDLYKSLHFVLITSVYEGFPMVMMEAMSHGVITISTNVGGINEHIIHNENGLLINAKHEDEIVNSFCNQILNLIKNAEERDKISKTAFDYASNHFGIDKFNQSYKNLFS